MCLFGVIVFFLCSRFWGEWVIDCWGARGLSSKFDPRSNSVPVWVPSSNRQKLRNPARALFKRSWEKNQKNSEEWVKSIFISSRPKNFEITHFNWLLILVKGKKREIFMKQTYLSVSWRMTHVYFCLTNIIAYDS